MIKPQLFARRYVLLDRIATGGMAEVFKAKSSGVEGFEKLVVIKRILPHLSKNARFISMFINEAKLAVSLTHGNIAQVFHLGKHGEDYYIAMEYVHGRDLMHVFKVCRKRGIKIPIPLLLHIAAETSRGLDYAHRKEDAYGNPLRIIHRDISPHNIVISFEGEVKIVDFGIARVASQIIEASSARLGGKFAYMSPEQARGLPMDPRSDLFSLGLVCYEALTGHKAFQGQGVADKLDRVRKAEFVPPQQLRPDLPPELNRILLKMLAPDPEDRYASAGDLYEELTEWMFAHGGLVTAQATSDFMHDLFKDDIAHEQEAHGLRAVLGNLEHIDQRTGTPTVTTEGSLEIVSLDESSPGDDPDQTVPPEAPPSRFPEEGSRKNLLVMCVEPGGLTELSTQLADQRYIALHAAFMEQVEGAILSAGGHPEHHSDDRITASWGMARTQEDDCVRCLNCAHTLKAIAKDFSDKHRVSLSLSVAIHHGAALVGRCDGHCQHMALGDTFRLPHRMLSQAAAGDILVTDVVRHLGEPWFLMARMEPLSVPWSRRAIPLFRLGAPRPHEEPLARKEAAPLRGDRWWPRGDELDVLRAALTSVLQWQGMVVGVTGEAGIGKSRLLSEVLRLVRMHRVGWRVGSSQYRFRDTPLSLVRDMIGNWCQIESQDTTSAIHEKLQPLLEMGMDPIDNQFIASLFRPFDDSHTNLNETPDGYEGIFRAVRRLVRGMCSDQPVVLLFEDLQWTDSMSLKLIQELAELSLKLPILFLLTYRLGFKPPFAGQPWFRQVEIGPLNRERTLQMAQSLLETDTLPPVLADELYRRSDGNPLHLEQLIKLLLEGGYIKTQGGTVQEVALHAAHSVPPTIQGLIESRVDSLTEPAREVLQKLAVIGRRGSRGVVQAVTGIKDLSDDLLLELVNRDLLTVEKSQISFRNHLTWEVAYQRILSKQRQDFHLQTGLTLEQLYDGDLRRHAEEIFHHFEAARDTVKAVRYATLAGDRYRLEDFNYKAIDYYRKAMDLLRECADPAVDESYILRQLSTLALKLGRIQWFVGDRAEAELSLERGLDLSGELEDDALEARILLELGRVRGDRGDRYLAQSYLEHALELSEVMEDTELSCQVLDALGTFFLEMGESEQSGKAFDRGLELAEGLESRKVLAPLLRGKGTYQIRTGAYDEALRTFTRALKLAEELEENVLCGRILNNIGNTHVYLENYGAAMEAYQRSGEILKSVGFMRGAVTNTHNIGDLYFRQRRLAKAYNYFVESRNLARDYRWALGEASNLVYMGYVEATKGEQDLGLKNIKDGITLAEKFGHQEFVGTGLWLEGLYFLDKDSSRARASLTRAHEIAISLKDRKLQEEVERLLPQLPAQDVQPPPVEPGT